MQGDEGSRGPTQGTTKLGHTHKQMEIVTDLYLEDDANKRIVCWRARGDLKGKKRPQHPSS